MRVDELTVELRPRSMAEAADLGARLVHRHAGSVWRSFAPVYVAFVLLAFCTAVIASWLPWVMIFWFKPWLDRSLLFVLSRAVFGQSTRWGDLWRHRSTVWYGQWLRTLLWRCFSPWRSYTQAIEQLEGQRGAARRKRQSQLLSGRRRAATGMQFIFANVEQVLCLASLSFALWFAPAGAFDDIHGWQETFKTLFNDWVTLCIYALVVFVLEPFYVAAGFAMYLNRRVEFEAWDIEQEFRHAF